MRCEAINNVPRSKLRKVGGELRAGECSRAAGEGLCADLIHCHVIFLLASDIFSVALQAFCISRAAGKEVGIITNQILFLGRILMLLLEVVEKVLDITAKAANVARGREKAVHAHLAVISSPQIPGAAGQRDLSKQGANRVDAAVPGQPDHELIVAARVDVIGVLGGKDIIGDVGTDVGTVISPSD